MNPDDNNVNQEVFNNFMTSLGNFPCDTRYGVAIEEVFNSIPSDNIHIENSTFAHLLVVSAETVLETFSNIKFWSSAYAHIVQFVSSSVPNPMYQQLRKFDPRIKEVLKIKAYVQLPMPLVQRREFDFYRVLKEVKTNEVWVIFDVSTDYFLHNSNGFPGQNSWRRRSGVIFTKRSHFCKVQWVEKVQAPATYVQDSKYSDLTKKAFSVKRWVLMLMWWFNRRKSLCTINMTGFEAQFLLLVLTAKMKMLFLEIVSGSPNNEKWITIENHHVRLMKSRTDVNIAGTNPCIAVTTFHLEASPSEALKFLQGHLLEIQWPNLGESVREREPWPMSKESFREREPEVVITSELDRNHITLLKRAICVNDSSKSEYLLHEVSSENDFFALVTAAPVSSGDVGVSLTHAIGTDIMLRPTGFAILPDGPDSKSSIITIAVRPPAVSDREDDTGRMVFVIDNMIQEIQERIRMLMATDRPQ